MNLRDTYLPDPWFSLCTVLYVDAEGVDAVVERGELEKERVKLAKRDRKEANELLGAVHAEDEPRVTHMLAIGVNPEIMDS